MKTFKNKEKNLLNLFEQLENLILDYNNILIKKYKKDLFLKEKSKQILQALKITKKYIRYVY